MNPKTAAEEAWEAIRGRDILDDAAKYLFRKGIDKLDAGDREAIAIIRHLGIDIQNEILKRMAA